MLSVLLMLLSAVPAVPTVDLDRRRDAFQKLLGEQWEYTLSHSPEFASILGDRRWNDKSSDMSVAEILRDQEMDRAFLKKFEAIDPAGFPEQEALTRTLLIRNYRESIQDEHWKNCEMPVTQISGLHLNAPQLVSLLPFDTVKDYADYTPRLKALPRQMEDITDRMRRGMAEGLMPPKFLLTKVADQAGAVAAE